MPALVDPHWASAGYRTIPAQDDGGHLEANAPALGQPRDAQAITEGGGKRRVTRAPHSDPGDAQINGRRPPRRQDPGALFAKLRKDIDDWLKAQP